MSQQLDVVLTQLGLHNDTDGNGPTSQADSSRVEIFIFFPQEIAIFFPSRIAIFLPSRNFYFFPNEKFLLCQRYIYPCTVWNIHSIPVSAVEIIRSWRRKIPADCNGYSERLAARNQSQRKGGEEKQRLASNSGESYVQSYRPLSVLWHALLATVSRQMLFHLNSPPLYKVRDAEWAI